MLVFPQIAQYPLRKRERARTIVNAMRDGSRVTYADADERTTEWDLRLAALTVEEWQSIETLAIASEGRLRNFTFLDPTANLLRRSEELDTSEWVKDPLMVIDGAVITNTGQVAQRISQTLEVPGWFHYTFSARARSTGGVTMTLVRGAEARAFEVGATWARYVTSGNLNSTDEQVTFAVELPAGGQVELGGMQVEAQTGASVYKKTTSQGGVYPNARFMDDALRGVAQGPNQFAGTLRIRCQQ
jgi:hypothetical protein